jgi:hypothetical protein
MHQNVAAAAEDLQSSAFNFGSAILLKNGGTKKKMKILG